MGSAQPITDAKLFKREKKFLGLARGGPHPEGGVVGPSVRVVRGSRLLPMKIWCNAHSLANPVSLRPRSQVLL
jgi:hypothetical protein